MIAISRTPCRATRSGFTPIELLVVISIVTLLIALLLPAIKRTRENARVAMCASNLRQLNIALHSYAHENMGMGPAYHPDDSDAPSPSYSNFNAWTLVLYGGKDTGGIWWGSHSRSEIPGRRKLNPYTSSFDVYRCPSDTGKIPSGGLYPNRWFDHAGTSYFYNSNWYGIGGQPSRANALAGASPWVLWGRRYNTIIDPSRLYSIADATIIYTWPLRASQGDGPHGSEFNWHDQPENHPDAPHAYVNLWFYDPRCNVGFLDGHAAFIKLGPHQPGDLSMNTDRYTIDPQYP